MAPEISPPGGRGTLVVEEVTKSYDLPSGRVEVLRGASFRLAAGEAVAIVGPSGSGKSTLLNIIGSLERPTSGRVLVGDIDVQSLSGGELAAYRSRTVGFVFQDHHLMPQCTALENVMLPTVAAAARSGRSADVEKRSRVLLAKVGLAARSDSWPAQLSGGERARVAVARALINEPKLLLCDEPTGNLDAASGSAVAELLLELVRERSLKLVCVTHNAGLAARIGRVLELSGGVLVERAAGESGRGAGGVE